MLNSRKYFVRTVFKPKNMQFKNILNENIRVIANVQYNWH